MSVFSNVIKPQGWEPLQFPTKFRSHSVLDFNLASAEREKTAGAFSVDLVGEDENGHTVIIENQLEKSDHDHLGKVLTCLASLDAKAAVWIVARPRPEHIKAITWLNESTSTPFYLIQVEAIRIGDSAPAPLLTRIAGPSAEARAAGATKKDLSERHEIRERFWTVFLGEAKTKSKLHRSISPGQKNWVGAGSGVRGLTWNYIVRQHDTQVELYIDRGDGEENADLFEQLFAHKDAVEAAFGEDLEWQRLEGKRACRIRHQLELGGWRDEEKWPSVSTASVDAIIRLEKALRSKLKSLNTVRSQDAQHT